MNNTYKPFFREHIKQMMIDELKNMVDDKEYNDPQLRLNHRLIEEFRKDSHEVMTELLKKIKEITKDQN